MKKSSSRIPIRSVEWLVTENCNYTCDYCALYNSNKPSRDLNEIRKFLIMVAQNRPNMLEILFLPEDCILHKDPVFEQVLERRKEFMSKTILMIVKLFMVVTLKVNG